MNLFSFTQTNESSTHAVETHPMIDLRGVNKSYKTAAGDYPVLKDINLAFRASEFISIIGKSGSGKTTLLNMITGIDRPTSGEVWVNGSPLHQMSEGQMARWRGRNLGIVFQFFQLLPTLSILENILLAMDFSRKFPAEERKQRAMRLLEMVELAEHAHKLPLALSGGQQQRVAIARALANDPPVLIADEPTGNLDSKTAESVFELFNQLVAQGKTIIIVTHDSSLAKRTHRTALIADGEIVNEYVAKAMPTLSQDQMLWAARNAKVQKFEAGTLIFSEGASADTFYVVSKGTVDVVLPRPGQSDVVALQLGPGKFFGEIAYFHDKRRLASIRASERTAVEVLAIGFDKLNELLNQSDVTRDALHQAADRHELENFQKREEKV